MAEQPSGQVAVATTNRSYLAQRWRLVLGVLITLGIISLALFRLDWIIEALRLALNARPLLLLLALTIILTSFLISSQVLQVVLYSLGYRISALRLWATTLVAIITSQSLPAGGLGSYAFLTHTLHQRGISSAHSALVATL